MSEPAVMKLAHDEWSAPLGINIIGHPTKNHSFGVTLRHFASALLERRVPIRILDLAAENRIQGLDLTHSEHFASGPRDLPHEINLFFLTITEAPEYLRALRESDFRWKDRLNALVTWWEIPQIPPHWCATLGAFDTLLCGSWFIRELTSFSVPCALPVYYDYPLRLPEFSRSTRGKFGIPDDKFSFYFSFDPFVGSERKNPQAVVAAFREAFASGEKAHLVIRLNAPKDYARRLPHDVQRFLADCERDPRISLILQSGPYDEALGTLDACCDCFVSLHRSEGLGLGPLEAMLLGKPVISTAWSGSMTYLAPSDASLVPYGFTSPKGWSAPFMDPTFLGVKGRWAEPLVSGAAAAMRRVCVDVEYRNGIASSGKAYAKAFVERGAECRFVDELAALLEMKRFGVIPRRTVECIQSEIARAEARHRGLRLQPVKRWLATKIPGLWTRLYG